MSGVIAIVSGMSYCKDEENLSLAIQQDGYSVLKIRNVKENPFYHRIPDSLRGVLFINSSLDKSMVHFLQKKKIPFISANIIPFLPEIPYIDYNNLVLYRILLETLAGKGYRHISFFNTSHLEGYNELAGRQIRKLKKEYGLPVEAYDYFNAGSEDSLSLSLEKYLSLCRRKDTFPEVLISNSNIFSLFREICISKNIRFSESMFFLYHRPRSVSPVQQENLFSFHSLEMNWRLWLQAYFLLRELLFGRDPGTVCELIERRIAFDQEIPKRS